MCDLDEAELPHYLAYLEAARARTGQPTPRAPRGELGRALTPPTAAATA